MTEPSRYDQLSPLARALVDDYDVLDLAEMLVKAQDELAALRATAIAKPSSWLAAGTRDLSIPAQHAFTARPVDPETERAATDRAVQAAADSEKSAAWFAAHSQPAPAATEATEHHYLSTGCLHDQHDYCSNVDGIAGLKKPAQCKFCTAPCQCPCHTTTKEN